MRDDCHHPLERTKTPKSRRSVEIGFESDATSNKSVEKITRDRVFGPATGQHPPFKNKSIGHISNYEPSSSRSVTFKEFLSSKKKKKRTDLITPTQKEMET